MNIFLLEDDILHQQRLELVIREILLEKRWSAKSIVTTDRPDSLLKKVKETVDQNIYFLDIEINGEKKMGLEIASQIRKMDPHGVIAFITTHSEFAPITYAYKVSAYDFIAKDSPIDEIKQHLIDCFENLLDTKATEKKEEMFLFSNQHSNFQVPFSDILYFETTDISHKIRLICKSRLVNFYATLGEIEKLDERFFKAHRSYVVNLENIVQIDRAAGAVYFDMIHSCAISRRRIKPALEKMNAINHLFLNS
ncbi:MULTISPECIES: response regulator transcription factor [Enterococcus]|uniref:Response regulator transcription factor n=1 Tax=Candidatus Enterococcus murrayae TaxID=2815321 RepID=A0ABS3HL88_9ENTE|nr:response regulator transcription factor [Enterococcus sp. MJM16]MBO0454210.1 response regulator transcription factor [Enterococcus sp. MJM16]